MESPDSLKLIWYSVETLMTLAIFPVITRAGPSGGRKALLFVTKIADDLIKKEE